MSRSLTSVMGTAAALTPARTARISNAHFMLYEVAGFGATCPTPFSRIVALYTIIGITVCQHVLQC